MRNKIKYNPGSIKQQPVQDVQLNITMKRIVKTITIKAQDPLLQYPYNKYYLSDLDEKQKFLTEIEFCRSHCKYVKQGFEKQKL